MNLNEQQLTELCEYMEVNPEDQEIREGLGDLIKSIRIGKYRSRFLEKGDTVVYFTQEEETNKFGKAVFVSGQLKDTSLYTSKREMASDISEMESQGFKTMKEGLIKRFLKLILRNIGRLGKLSSVVGFIGYSIAALAFGWLAIPAVAGLGLAYSVSYASSWAMVKVFQPSEKMKDKEGLQNYAKAQGELNQAAVKEGIITGDDEKTKGAIRDMVRESIKTQATQGDVVVETFRANGVSGLSTSQINEAFDATISQYKDRFGGKPPKSAAMQSPENKKDVVLFLSHSGKNLILQMSGQRVVREDTVSQAIFDNKIEDLGSAGWKVIDTRSWLKRNWKMLGGILAAGIITGIGAFLLGDLIVDSPEEQAEAYTRAYRGQSSPAGSEEDWKRMQDFMRR